LKKPEKIVATVILPWQFALVIVQMWTDNYLYRQTANLVKKHTKINTVLFSTVGLI
jgi:hypothetical protein